MPKYTEHKVAGNYLYYTSHCIIEAMHVHASNEELVEKGSAKFFVKSNGDTEVRDKGRLNDHEISVIQRYIKKHYQEMYKKWSARSSEGFFEG